MPFNINNFLSNIQQYGHSSVNKFDVNIALPNILTSAQNNSLILQDLPSLLSFRAQSINLPNVIMLSNESNRYGVGPLVKQPYNAVYGNLTTTFIADNQGIIYNFFFYWLNAIYNFGETNVQAQTISASGTNFSTLNYNAPTYTTGYEDDIVASSININIYDDTGKIIQIVNAFRAKPILLTTTPLSWDNTNNLFKIVVGFTFKEWSLEFPNAAASVSTSLT